MANLWEAMPQWWQRREHLRALRGSLTEAEWLEFCELEERKLPVIHGPVSCGCCRQGCVCHMHMDIPGGVRPQRCMHHSGTGKVEYSRA